MRPVSIEIIVRLSGRGLSQREMSRIIGVSHGAISKVLRLVRDTSSFTEGIGGASIVDDHIRGDCALFHVMRSNKFLSAPRSRVERIRLIGCRVFVHSVQGR